MQRNFNRHPAGRGQQRSEVLRRLLAEGRRARGARLLKLKDGQELSDMDRRSPIACRIRAAGMVERSLFGSMPRVVDLGSYLARVAGRQQLASASIGVLSASAPSLLIRSKAARAIAVAVTEIIQFIDAGVPPGGSVVVYLALAHDGGGFVIGVAAEGDFRPVAAFEASRGLVRAIGLVEALGGEFGRGVDRDRLVFGINMGAHHLAPQGDGSSADDAEEPR